MSKYHLNILQYCLKLIVILPSIKASENGSRSEKCINVVL